MLFRSIECSTVLMQPSECRRCLNSRVAGTQRRDSSYYFSRNLAYFLFSLFTRCFSDLLLLVLSLLSSPSAHRNLHFAPHFILGSTQRPTPSLRLIGDPHISAPRKRTSPTPRTIPHFRRGTVSSGVCGIWGSLKGSLQTWKLHLYLTPYLKKMKSKLTRSLMTCFLYFFTFVLELRTTP